MPNFGFKAGVLRGFLGMTGHVSLGDRSDNLSQRPSEHRVETRVKKGRFDTKNTTKFCFEKVKRKRALFRRGGKSREMIIHETKQ